MWLGRGAIIQSPRIYSKIPLPTHISHLLSTDELNVLKSYSNFTARISLSPPFPPCQFEEREEKGRDNKTENRWMNCWYMTEVGSRLSSNTRMGKDSSMDHGAIVRGIVLLSLSLSLFHTALETRRVTQIPNTCAAFCREVCTVGAEGGEYIPPAPSSFPLGKRNNNGRANGERDVWRVLVHKIRPVSLKPVVQDIGRAYIKNRHRDEWIPENPSSGIVVPPTTFREGSLSRPLFFDCYRCCIARWLSSSANLSNFSRGFRHEQPLSTTFTDLFNNPFGIRGKLFIG